MPGMNKHFKYLLEAGFPILVIEPLSKVIIT
jgi:hypothetical protein